MNTVLTKLLFTGVVLLTLAVFTVKEAKAQADSVGLPELGRTNWSIGVKFSNPSGISVKKYLGDHALELNVGRYNPWNNNNLHYLKHYDDLDEDHYYDHLEFISRPIALQIHYVKHDGVIKSFPGLSYYYGAGAQVRTGSYYYHYYYYDQADVKIYGNERRWFISGGIDGVLGLDYTFKSIPFTVFSDLTVYVEAMNHPFFTQIRTGSGIRYNF